MKKLNNKEIIIIKEALESQIDGLYEYSYRLLKENDIKESDKFVELAKEVEKVLRKLSQLSFLCGAILLKTVFKYRRG